MVPIHMKYIALFWKVASQVGSKNKVPLTGQHKVSVKSGWKRFNMPDAEFCFCFLVFEAIWY